MSLNQTEPESVQDTDGFSIDTAVTPSETIHPDTTPDNNGPLRNASYPISHTVPKAGSTFIIRSVSSRNVLTLLKGEVVLAPPDTFGSPHWECVETDGWLGFRNIASYGYLGRDGQSLSLLCCFVKWHQECEWFHIGSRSEGGFVLIMTCCGRLQQIGFKEDKGEKRLAMMDNGVRDGIVVWEFVEV